MGFFRWRATLEITLIDQIVDYIKQQMYLLSHPWFNEYMISIGSNGMLYDTRDVQDFIKKNYSRLSISITLDGTKRKHDLNRVKKDGSGSYDEIIKNIPLWLQQFPAASTKVTFASADLRYIKESIIHLWDLAGTAAFNVIPKNTLNRNHCMAGINDFTLAPNGKFYACPAYYFDNKNDTIGDLEEGININEPELLTLSKARSCAQCGNGHCLKCTFINKKANLLVNVPAKVHCDISATGAGLAKSL